MGTVTQLLDSVNGGRDGAFSDLVEATYGDLRRIAAARMRRAFDRSDGGLENLTVRPTEIADDVVVELMRQRAQWANRDQFFAVATLLMVRKIRDYQRRRMSGKRGAGMRGQELDGGERARSAAPPEDVEQRERLVRCVMRLHDELDPRKAEVVTLHMVCGWELGRVAEAVGVSLATVERDWRFAKAWIRKEM